VTRSSSVYGEDVYSELCTDTISLKNEAKAKAVFETVLKLVAYEGGEMSDVASGSIKARHILAITPYSGQAALLWTRFKEIGLITDVEADLARINSFSQVQGDKELTILVSFCSNNPERESADQFAAEKHGLTIAISRARAFMILFCNFKSEAEAKMNTEKGRERLVFWFVQGKGTGFVLRGDEARVVAQPRREDLHQEGNG
jgi:superfamily I DNA and/or RNA helicase